MESLPAPSSRQLVRRRTGRDAMTSRIQRCRSPASASAAAHAPMRSRLPPPSPGNIAVVRPTGSTATTTRIRRDRESQREPPMKPPPQILSTKALRCANPYLDDQPARERRSVTQQSRRMEVKTTNRQRPIPVAFGGQNTVAQPQPAFRSPAPPPNGSKIRQRLRSVRAKVDSYLCPHLSGPSPPTQPAARRPCRPVKNNSMAEAHEQLELLLARIERASDFQTPPPPPPAAHPKRRGQTKVAKGARRQMAQHPPVPAGSPILSARAASTTKSQTYPRIGGAENRRTRSEEDHLPHVVPLVQNPQRLPSAKRDALLQLLQRAEQHDKGIVDFVASATGDPSRDTMLMLLQMLPLSPNDSPYAEKFWEGQRYLKERQKLHQTLRPGDERFKEVKVLRSPEGEVFPSRTLEEELKDEKRVLDNMEAQLRGQGPPGDRHPLNERQEQAMREREELERYKQQVTSCREQRRQEQARLIEPKSSWGCGADTPKEQASIREIPSNNPPSPRPTDPLKQLLQDRDRFQANCRRSCFYNNSQSSAPWKIYAKVASKLSSQLIDNLDAEFHRCVANYIKDIVGNKLT
ncbi:RNA-binding protein 33 [Drosophila elegans]|uniref:RNA-binding protein 33 n=1 Tax=Drosophila elegans TaxID=30023 RepID=UPI001BC84F34|nr:RNA-binding protein 33 [Drosophila elegans]